MAPILALGLSFPSCTMKLLEFLISWCFELAVLWVCSKGVRGPVRVLLGPEPLPRANDHPSCLCLISTYHSMAPSHEPHGITS